MSPEQSMEEANQQDNASSAEGSLPEHKRRITKTLRACDNCRKQKMRCIGSSDPPCKRCRNANLECVFSRQPREPPPTSAVEERMKRMEAQMESMGSMLESFISALQGDSLKPHATAGPSTFTLPPPFDDPGPLPSLHASNSALLGIPSLSESSSNGNRRRSELPDPPTTASYTGGPGHPPGSADADDGGLEDDAPLDIKTSSLLAPLDSMHSLAEAAAVAASAQTSVASVAANGGSGTKRGASGPPDAQRDKQRPRVTAATSGDGKGGRTGFAVKGKGKSPQDARFVSCIQAKIVTEVEARDLYKTFWAGADKFVAVFDQTRDTFELHRDEQPFCLNAIAYVASFIEDGGSGVSERQKRLWELVKQNAMETLFSKTSKVDAVQSLMLVAAWNEEGWLCGGHAVRLALDIGCHDAFFTLLETGMGRGKSVAELEGERDLVVKARTWFYLFNFEHQMAFGKGRPTIVSVDEGILRCRDFLKHPLAILTDMKLVATTEVMTLRSRYIKQLMPHGEASIDDKTIQCIRDAHDACEQWYQSWKGLYSRQQASNKKLFYIESARVTKEYTQLFHNCVALRGVQTPADVDRMTTDQRELALRAITNARSALTICLYSESYRQSFRHAVHHTFVTAAFAASLLIRIARLFPQALDLKQTAKDVEALARLLDTVPAGRYARSLRLTLRSARRQDVLPPPSPSGLSRAGSPTRRAPAFNLVLGPAGPEPSILNAAPADGILNGHTAGGQPGVLPSPSSADVDYLLSAAFGDGVVVGSTVEGAATDAPGGFGRSTGGDWDFSQDILDQIGLSLDSDGQPPLWLHSTNPGSSQLWTGGMEDFFLPSDVDSQLSFAHALLAPSLPPPPALPDLADPPPTSTTTVSGGVVDSPPPPGTHAKSAWPWSIAG